MLTFGSLFAGMKGKYMKPFSDETRRRMSESAKARCTSSWRLVQSKSKSTPLDMGSLKSMYESGMTQVEIATRLGVTQKVVWRAMRRFGISTRVAAKRNQTGVNNSSWVGDAACYSALHARVYKERGKPSVCEKCMQKDGRFEWSNKSGNYTDVSDYERLCVSCHRKVDGKRRLETGLPTSKHISKTKAR